MPSRYDHKYSSTKAATLAHIKSQSPPPAWIKLPTSRAHIDRIAQAADDHAFIDPTNQKGVMWRRVLNGGGSFFVMEAPTAGALVYYISEQKDEGAAMAEVDWDLWGRIFQAFGAPSGKRWEVIIFATDRPRVLPERDQLIGPHHINGGSARPCEPNSILIVRREESSRVLLHELLHAACTDDHSRPVDDMEGWTEAWAEWFLCALVAQNPTDFDRLWKKQVAWALAQAAICHKRGHIRSIRDYGARYIVRRIHIWRELGIVPVGLPPFPVVNSLRFTVTDLGL